MDFHSLCQKLDVDSLRARMPALPALPPLPQIKFPKSMPKIKSRKIFRTSREDVNRDTPSKQLQQQQSTMGSQSGLAPPIPPAGFIKQTPTRISTISSLMHQDSGDDSTYRSAGSIDDDCPTTRQYGSSASMRAISPVRMSAATQAATTKETGGGATGSRLSLTEKLQRSYKDLTDFRIKNLFTKKTVVRKDSIQVQHYVARYEEDLVHEAREQERRDLVIADNYTFRFKMTRQNTGHSNSVTPDDSPRSQQHIATRATGRSVGELSGDESGMEATPPMRKPGIAATRFAKVRNPPLRQSSSEQEFEEPVPLPAPNPSAVWSNKLRHANQKDVTSKETQSPTNTAATTTTTTTKTKLSYKARMRKLTGYVSNQSATEDTDAPEPPPRNESASGSTKMLSKLKGLGKRADATKAETNAPKKRKAAPTTPQSSDEEHTPPAKVAAQEKPFGAIKQQVKRLQQSMKSRSRATTTDESEDEAAATQKANAATSSKSETLTSRLRRFRSRDVSVDDLDEEDDVPKPPTNQSPMRQVISNKIDNWKKSFKKKTNRGTEQQQQQPSDAETSPEKDKSTEKAKRGDTLIKKLKHIRTRKQADSKEDLDAATDGETGEQPDSTSKSKSSKFVEARQRTLRKVNEKMQQLKFFHKSQEQREPSAAKQQSKYHSEEEDWDESPSHESNPAAANAPPTITRRDFPPTRITPDYNSEPEEDVVAMETINRPISFPGARAAWTTKPPRFSESLESDTEGSEFPRVLIHQDNSDCFESTLIIAVTRPPLSLRNSMTPTITEIPPETRSSTTPEQDRWVSNKQIIAGFLEATPPGSRRKKSLEAILPPAAGHTRRSSMDSNSNSNSDSESAWLAESKYKEQTSRRESAVGLISIEEQEEAWKVQAPQSDKDATTTDATLYKTKSIDIFENNVLKGGVLTAFEDFDDELRNEPVLKITEPARSADSCERESSEDTPDDDNSSRITKISMNRVREGSAESTKITAAVTIVAKDPKEHARDKMLQHYGNSRESLIANFDENDENGSMEDEEEDDDDDDDDRPPSAEPSPPPKLPPPPSMSPPPPPLPQRQPSIQLPKHEAVVATAYEPTEPPPLPKSKPPLPPTTIAAAAVKRAPPPPHIPERRTASMTRAARPLVKTSSLRQAYSEQIKPADVGKVNKLISQFEPAEGKPTQRPRIIPHRIQQDDSDDYSDDDEDYATMADKLKERYANIKIERDTTPTPTNTPKIHTPEAMESPQRTSMQDFNLQMRIKREMIIPMLVTTTDEDNNTKILTQFGEPHATATTAIDTSGILPNSDTNANHSRPSSIYGSPLEFPSSLRGSMETIPTLERQQRMRSVERHSGRSRRSMTRDDDNFYSFDSDEENSYYSISSTGSNRYIVEL